MKPWPSIEKTLDFTLKVGEIQEVYEAEAKAAEDARLKAVDVVQAPAAEEVKLKAAGEVKAEDGFRAEEEEFAKLRAGYEATAILQRTRGSWQKMKPRP